MIGLTMEELMAPAGRTRLTAAPPTVEPVKKRRGRPPLAQKNPPASLAQEREIIRLGFASAYSALEDVSPQPHDNITVAPDTRYERAVDALLAEYTRQRDMRDQAQAKLDYLDELYAQMTGGPLTHET